MIIKSFVGGHSVNVFNKEDVVFDASIRKYRLQGEATPVIVIPFSGKMLSAKISQEAGEPVIIDGVTIPTKTAQVFTGVDALPPIEEADLCVVSALYVAACKATGVDTSRLLTMGDTVVDADGRVAGILGFNRN